MNVLNKTLLAAALTAAGFAGQAHAQSMTDTFNVSITVEGTCNALATSDINFGETDIGIGDVDQTGNVTVRCSLGHPYSIQLDGGNAGDSHARTMLLVNGARENTVSYSLSAVSHGGAVWGDVQRSDLVYGTGAGLGTDVSHTVYGRATLTGDEALGVYNDVITATLSF